MIDMQTILKSRTKEYKITTDGPVSIIGESINPTWRKKLTAIIRASDLMLGRDAFAARFIKDFRKRQALGLVPDGAPTKA